MIFSDKKKVLTNTGIYTEHIKREFHPLQIIEDGINSKKNIKSKGIDWDLVTEYDRKIEDKLIKQLSIQFPSHK